MQKQINVYVLIQFECMVVNDIKRSTNDNEFMYFGINAISCVNAKMTRTHGIWFMFHGLSLISMCAAYKYIYS